MECKNGNLVNVSGNNWDACLNEGSIRVRCPKDRTPCNGLTTNRKEFKCVANCSKWGGPRECVDTGDFFLQMYNLLSVLNLRNNS